MVNGNAWRGCEITVIIYNADFFWSLVDADLHSASYFCSVGILKFCRVLKICVIETSEGKVCGRVGKPRAIT